MNLDKMDGRQNKKLFINIGVGLVTRALVMIAPLSIMPMILHYIGSEMFGLWMTLLSITSMSLFLDFGVSNSLLTKLAKAYHNGDIALSQGYISSAYFLLVLIALVLVVMLCAANFFNFFDYLIPSRGSFGSSLNDKNECRNIIFVTFSAFALGFSVSIIQRIQYAMQMAWMSNLWQLLGSILTIVFTYIAIEFKLQSYQVITLYIITPIITMFFANVIFFIINHPELAPTLKSVSKYCTYELSTLGFKFLVLGILTAVAPNIDNLIIAHKMNYSAVTGYALPVKLMSILGMIITVTFLPFWPIAGEALVKKDYFWIKKMAFRMGAVSAIFVGLSGVFLLMFNKEIMHFWMGRAFPQQVYIFAFFIFFWVATAFASPFQMILNTAGQLNIQILAWSLYLLISTIIKYQIIDFFGPWSLAMVSALCFTILILPTSCFFAYRIMKD